MESHRGKGFILQSGRGGNYKKKDLSDNLAYGRSQRKEKWGFS